MPNIEVQGSCLIIPSNTAGIPNFTRWDPGHTVTLDYFGTPSKIVTITSFDSVYQGTWPGELGLNADFNIPTSNYLSLQFTVPPNYFGGVNAPATNIYDDYYLGTSGYSTLLSMSVSTKCGDFSSPIKPGSTVLANCLKNNIHSNQALIVNQPDSTTCPIENGKTYYLNMINADVSSVGINGTGTATSNKALPLSKCSGTACSNGVQNAPGIGAQCWSSDHWLGTAGGPSCSP